MILAAERLLGMIPRKTHDWRMFIKPAELTSVFAAHGLAVGELRGMTPARSIPRVAWSAWRHKRFGEFALSNDLSVSYIGYAVRG